MWKNGANTAIDIKTFGNSNANVNSDVLIRIESRGDPTPGTRDVSDMPWGCPQFCVAAVSRQQKMRGSRKW